MSVVDDAGLVLLVTAVVGSTWYGVAPYLAGLRHRRAGRPVDRQADRELGTRLRDGSVTAA